MQTCLGYPPSHPSRCPTTSPSSVSVYKLKWSQALRKHTWHHQLTSYISNCNKRLPHHQQRRIPLSISGTSKSQHRTNLQMLQPYKIFLRYGIPLTPSPRTNPIHPLRLIAMKLPVPSGTRPQGLLTPSTSSSLVYASTPSNLNFSMT